MHNRFAIAPHPSLDRHFKNKKSREAFLWKTGAGNESRTRDLNLGKVALYQLSYSRKKLEARAGVEPTYTDLQSGA